MVLDICWKLIRVSVPTTWCDRFLIWLIPGSVDTNPEKVVPKYRLDKNL